MGGKEITQLGLVLYEQDIHLDCNGLILRAREATAKGRDVKIWTIDSCTVTAALRTATLLFDAISVRIIFRQYYNLLILSQRYYTGRKNG